MPVLSVKCLIHWFLVGGYEPFDPLALLNFGRCIFGCIRIGTCPCGWLHMELMCRTSPNYVKKAMWVCYSDLVHGLRAWSGIRKDGSWIYYYVYSKWINIKNNMGAEFELISRLVWFFNCVKHYKLINIYKSNVLLIYIKGLLDVDCVCCRYKKCWTRNK